ncbi:MAG: phosphoribosylglycinamide formyltransferase [Candidatus Omnitrophota bacterium]|nr:phosphoribosylglycinamide formyltransferase [Candidatus Omnitrophota bacterium]
MNIAILASGNGTNFQALAQAVRNGSIKARISVLLTDNEGAFVRLRARRHHVRDIFVDPKEYASRLQFDARLIEILKKEKIDLVVLAGFMRIVSPRFVRVFKNRILNIHPALLPAFKGERSIERAFAYGCKIAGVTVHFVDEAVDQGPIILQEAIPIRPGMSLATLEDKIHRLEHRLYPLAVKLFVEGKLKISGRVVKIK